MNAPHLADLETPCLLLDLDRLNHNIHSMQERARRHGVALRPHVKTHKSLRIAQLQLAAGAAGVTASKTDEALVFIEGGVPSLTLAYPVLHPAKLDRLFAAARRRATDLRLVIDSAAGLAAISAAAARHDFSVRVYIEIDVGLRRCGLREGDPAIPALARQIEGTPRLAFAGLLSHAGHAYGAPTAAEVAAIAAEECAILGRVRATLDRAGLPVPEVSVGSTPTVLASPAYDGITEIRPGNYAFLDLTPVRKGLAAPDQLALSVLATVVSANDDFFIIDAGSKTLSSDAGAHGLAAAPGFGLAWPLASFPSDPAPLTVAKLSEEHGFIPRGLRPLALGDKVRILPNHACPVANLSKEYVVIENDRIIDRWPVDARGCVL